MSIDELGWFTINILILIFLPLFGVLPFKILPLPIGNEIRLISLVKDGQWCWTSICIHLRGILMREFIRYQLNDLEKVRNSIFIGTIGFCIFSLVVLLFIK